MSLTANKSDKIPMKLSENVASQAFCLRWNNFHSNMLDVFERLFLDERFVDVTLACEGQLIKAHKMVLSASSSYFQEIFTTTPCPHPVIIMKDVPLKDLRKILEFMYKGEINVSKQEITSLLVVAEVLHVRGLTQIDTNNDTDNENDNIHDIGNDNNEPQPSTSNANISTTENQKSNKLNRLLKRTSARESSVESLVLIEEDEPLLQPAKQVKIIINDTSIKSQSPQNTTTDELAYNSMHETEDDFLESAAEYDATDDFDPISIESVQIKQEEDIISNYSTDNGDGQQDCTFEMMSDSLQHIEFTETIKREDNNQQQQPSTTMEDMFKTLVHDHKMMLKRVKMLEEVIKKDSITEKRSSETIPLQSRIRGVRATNLPMSIDKITSVEKFLRFESAVISDQNFRKNIINALVERVGNRYTPEDRVTCALMLNRLLFVPEFFKLCSWTGRSKDDVKFPLQKHTNFLDFFNSAVRQSSSTVLSEIELRDFFSSRIRNSFYSPKTDIIPTSRKRVKKHK